jgi:hypothetical protein
MTRLFEDISWMFFPQKVYEMANMQPRDTGLNSIVHVMYKGGAKHSARIKVSNIAGTFHPDDNFTITAEHEPRIIGNAKLKKEHVDKIVDWVKLNHDHIHKVWHHGDIMSGTEIDEGFKKL